MRFDEHFLIGEMRTRTATAERCAALWREGGRLEPQGKAPRRRLAKALLGLAQWLSPEALHRRPTGRCEECRA